jgi:hypothetical protein
MGFTDHFYITAGLSTPNKLGTHDIADKWLKVTQPEFTLGF